MCDRGKVTFSFTFTTARRLGLGARATLGCDAPKRGSEPKTQRWYLTHSKEWLTMRTCLTCASWAAHRRRQNPPLTTFTYGFGALVPDPGVAGIGERSDRRCGRHLTWESSG